MLTRLNLAYADQARGAVIASRRPDRRHAMASRVRPSPTISLSLRPSSPHYPPPSENAINRRKPIAQRHRNTTSANKNISDRVESRRERIPSNRRAG